MVVVESYTQLIADSINTHLPNASNPSSSSPNLLVESVATTNCIYLASPSSSSTTASIVIPSSEADDRSRLLVILRWLVRHFKIVYKSYLEKYMKHPIALALLPLLVGLGAGLAIGWYYCKWNHSFNKDHDDSCKLDHCVHNDDEQQNDVQQQKQECYEYNARNKKDPTQTNRNHNHSSNNDTDDNEERDSQTRTYLQSPLHTQKESKIPIQHLPQHIAIIMDGNRRYGKTKYNSITRGHWDGSKTLIDFAKWCIAEHIEILTVYAFSTENWNRSREEVSSLMRMFCKYCDELRVEAKERGICVRVLSTETDKIPNDVASGIHKMTEETKNNTKLTLNICLSYGSRGEIINACQSIATDVQHGRMSPQDINETHISQKLLTANCPDPDLVIRTSGEYRLSNFLLWQLAYSEMFFVEKNWPELTKQDLVRIINSFAIDRKRRYGK